MHTHEFKHAQIAYKVAEAFFHNTWFSTECCNGCMHTRRGTMAGMSLADLVYTVAFARVLKATNDALLHYGVTSAFDDPAFPMVLREVRFVDDVMVPVVDKDAASICGKVVSVAKLLATVYAMFGLEVNFDMGKTNALVCMRGSSARKAQLELDALDYQIKFSYGLLHATLFFVDVYKHMGTQVSVAHDLKHEVFLRGVYIRTGLKTFHKIFLNRCLTTKKKVTIVKAYLFAGGTFQCSAWPNLCITLYRKFHQAVVAAHRKATCSFFNPLDPGQDMLSDADLIQEYSLVSPLSTLRSSRSSLLSRIISKAPPMLLDMVRATSGVPGGWGKSVQSDLAWLSLAGHGFGCTLEEAPVSIHADPEAFLRRVKAFAHSRFANLDLPSAAPNLSFPSMKAFFCELCGKTLPCKQKFALHKFKHHKIKDCVRCYVPEHVAHCCVCLPMFHSRERLLNHLRYRSSVCKINLILAGDAISNQDADAIDEKLQPHYADLQRRGFRRYRGRRPAFRLPGPLPYAVIEPGTESAHHVLGRVRNNK